MRFSLQSLAICLVSTQASFALAGPCRPLTKTSVGATTTVATSEEFSTTAIVSDVSTVTSEEETSTTTVSQESTTTAAFDVSTTTTLAEESTSATLAGTTITVLAETTPTTMAGVSTTTMAETTTTVAAETTTTVSGPEASLFARLDDGSEVGVYLQTSGFIGTKEAPGTQPEFALEADTSRLYATFPDGSKVYAYTVIPVGGNYGFLFDQHDFITAYPAIYSFIACTADSDLFLTCASENGPTSIYWYLPSNSPNFYGNSNPTVAASNGNTPAQLRLPVA
ncbi:unnamed protein product [Fusarium equiseti]|uniref:Uncharacterized protein n=1 Tax=Fusarium equiseti TaxID=61235 RepID=A0A8J2IMM9_FUSEQ|nr:unnamed protein product [Fusarium equiseti]